MFAYFDPKIGAAGFTHVLSGGTNSALPESGLLPKANLRRYLREPKDSETWVQVAAWPIDSASVEGLHVVLTTYILDWLRMPRKKIPYAPLTLAIA